MPLGTAFNSLRLLLKNLNTNTSTIPIVKKIDQDKPFVFPRDEKINYLSRSTPEKEGMRKEYIDSFIKEVDSDLSIRINRLLIIENNKVIYEKYNHPYQKDSWNCVFSFSKSVVSLALGVLYDEGKVDLDIPVCQILDNEKKIKKRKNRQITLRHLLTHSTGISFNEMESASSYKWVKDYFNSKSKFKFGSKFEYNSMNTYILSVCVEKLAGMKFEQFCREKIFDRLGIAKTYFDLSPEGYFKGGWGLYILPEDMAKLGILVRDFGKYDGHQIISQEWIRMMTSKQFDSTKYGHSLDYGFQVWVNEKLNFCTLNGMYDQNAMIYRNSGVVIVTCSSNNEAFHGSNLFKIAHKYFASKEEGEFPLCVNEGNHEVKNYDNLLYYFDYINKKEYKSLTKVSHTCGILPLLLQNELGTYVKGIKSVSFKKENDDYFFIIKEGEDIHHLKFNFKDGVRQLLTMYGNVFDVAVDGRFILSGKGEVYLLIRVFFLEYPSSRFFTIKFGKNVNAISIECSENPGLDFVRSLIEIQDKKTKHLIRNALNAFNHDLIAGKIRNIFAPTFVATCGDSYNLTTYNKIKEKNKKSS